MIESWSPLWLDQRAAKSPDALALVDANSSICWSALHQRVAQLADELRGMGAGQGDVVAVLAGGGIAAVELIHATQAIGAILLPLHLRQTPVEIAHPLRETQAKLLVHDADDATVRTAISACAQAGGVRRAILEHRSDDNACHLRSDSRQTGPSCAPLDHAPALEDPMAVLYTSGTTGTPKGAILPYRSFLESARGSQELLGLRENDRWLACMPLYHVGGLSIVTRCVLAGASIHAQSRFDAKVVCQTLESEPITMLSLVPTMLARLLDAWGERASPASLRRILVGGAEAPEVLLSRARERGFPVLPTYGLTEAASQVATRSLSESKEPLGGRLQPLHGTSIEIRDEQGRCLEPGTPGEICVRAKTLMSGYWGRPQDTGRVLRDGWLHTGDVGALDGDGMLTVRGRRSDLIVSGGENVYPAEIEAVLAEHPGVEEAAVVGQPDPKGDLGERPRGWVVRRLGTHVSESELLAHCAPRLARYKLPISIDFVTELPRNATGKLLRRALRPDPRT